MLKKTKYLLATASILMVLGSFCAFKHNDRLFDITKNIELFATLFKEVNTYYVDDVSPNTFVKKGIDAMLESLDPYTNYIPEDEIEDFRTMTTGQYGGIGAIIGKRNEKPLVMMVYEGFPAHKSGLCIGDEILNIDGIDVVSKANMDISKLLKGQSNTQVKVSVKRFGVEKPLDFVITREKIKVENVPFTGMIDQEIGFIKLSDFTNTASKEVKKSLLDLKEKGAKQIIFDLRDNPGGLLTEAINISNLFIPKDKEIVKTKGKVSEWNKTYNALNTPVDTEIPLVILTNGRSASASEIVSGVIQDYDRGVLVGQKTFGKGLVQATRPLPYNAQLKITTAKYYIPSGRCIQAIDYAHRNEDGTVGTYADSLRKAFKTSKGREVFDGGGVSPDVVVEENALAPITISLLTKSLIFDYATKYYFEHKTITAARNFKLNDKDYEQFITWLSDKDYDYVTKVETSIVELIEHSKKEKYYDGIKNQIETLKSQVSHNKEKDLQTFKSEIMAKLEEEIISRYYYQKGLLEASFNKDNQVLAAIKILKDKAAYQSKLK
jgi:carboxyl-terminal processing protease